MNNNYAKLVADNLARLYEALPGDQALRMGSRAEGDAFVFYAFGEPCRVSPDGILLGEAQAEPILGILISLYALHAGCEEAQLMPFRAFKEFPGSMPYTGAFATHTEQILAPHAAVIQVQSDRILQTLKGNPAPGDAGGDFAFVVRPLPKIALCYIFYHADEDFPASTTCLFSRNATSFMPMDGLADIGEYTSRKILSLL